MSGSAGVILLSAFALGALVKAVSGVGVPLVAVPVAALFTDFQDAVVTASIPSVLANGVLVYRERSHRPSRSGLGRLALFGALGAIVGVAAFTALPSRLLAVGVVVVITAYVAAFFADLRPLISATRSRRWGPLVGTGAGALHGATGLSGPVVQMWLHSHRLDPGVQVFSAASIFLFMGSAQALLLTASGEMAERLGFAALASAVVAIMLPVGARWRERLSGRTFDLVVIGVLVASALALIVESVAH
ncbi:MAG: sulfite exporter TauE/SafE family protein [Actinomycetota bacterium]